MKERDKTTLGDIMRMVKKDNRYAVAALIISILAMLMPVIVYVFKSFRLV